MQKILKSELNLALLSTLLLSSCGTKGLDLPEINPVKVCFSIEESATKANVREDGITSVWEEGDEVNLWARNSGGQYSLNQQRFKILAKSESKAIFTTMLDSPMAEDIYDYTVCYPAPQSVENTVLEFNIPSEQDGRAGHGANIMISKTVKAGPLRTYGEQDGLSLSMNHLVHLLKFYLPKGSNGLDGENVRRIELSMPDGICGDIKVDLSDPTAIVAFGNQEKNMVLSQLDLAPSNTEKVYASAAIFPAVNINGELKIVLYSDRYASELAPVNIDGRTFAAGHCTAVPLEVTEVHPYYSIAYILKANNLGENIQKITFSAPSGCKFGDDLENLLVIEPGKDILVGQQGRFSYRIKENYLSLSGKTITVTYDSEHAESVQTISLPDLSKVSGTSVNLTVPYLLFEDFSSVPSFSSNDTYCLSSAGNKSAYSFLNGWSGGRVGASAGTSIRIAGRRECGLAVDVHYPARVESAVLSKLKKSTDVILEFDYGCDREYVLTGDVGQNVYVGYVTSTKKYSSCSMEGTYPHQFSSKETGGSWTNLPSHFSAEMTLPAGSSNRISWRNDPEAKYDFGSNTTSWLYIDNVKVRIKNHE